MYRKKLFEILTIETYLKIIKIDEVDPSIYNCRKKNLIEKNQYKNNMFHLHWSRCSKLRAIVGGFPRI